MDDLVCCLFSCFNFASTHILMLQSKLLDKTRDLEVSIYQCIIFYWFLCLF
jgi:hypothetical protein